MIKKIGLGGGCHWCTEAVFVSLRAVEKVDQGFIRSLPPNDNFSEAVIVTFNDELISLNDLVEIHLHTHSASSHHSMRDKYRSAVYYFNEEDAENTKQIMITLQRDFEELLITKILPFVEFKPSLPLYENYYYSDPEKPFCKLYITPKLELLKKKYSNILSKH